ncbi:cellulose biosynthesis protein BcsQ [Teichococcus vastitatis]|uniref:Cellulose biosynthesis protein BcsQ n=1 Tax=Teichococcus vastitatis TaxID=2307076 RepID=A0ABS9W0L7_9PROT|nr:cellulose biosynthesis protein BcsQ [Pseudoroseomonas vastitatis]MCI0752573.1 cellulose biosynthesis protein BcsQ [Pseudoroseomonas vastitatis]
MPLILIASPKGGVGKTTLAANLADGFRRNGRPVLLLDLDPQNALRLHFGIPVQDVGGYLADRTACQDWRAHLRQVAPGLLLLPHGAVELRAALENALALEQDPSLLQAPLRDMLADPSVLVVADLPPGPSPALQVTAPLASLVLTVLQSEPISAAMLAEVESGRFLGSGTLPALFAGRLHFLLNGVDLQSRLSRSSAETMARHLGPRLVGAVSRDEALAEALAYQRPLLDHAPQSAAAADLRQVTAAVEALLPSPEALPQPAVAYPLTASRGAW